MQVRSPRLKIMRTCTDREVGGAVQGVIVYVVQLQLLSKACWSQRHSTWKMMVGM